MYKLFLLKKKMRIAGGLCRLNPTPYAQNLEKRYYYLKKRYYYFEEEVLLI
jgi:hypothetical protein